MAKTFTITELAREFDVTLRTIRYYEDEGMLSPLRQGQHRIYRPRDRVRLKLILRGKRLGFKLAEIREILDLYDSPPGEPAQLRYLLTKIGRRREELENKRQDVEAALLGLDNLATDCRARLAALEGETEPAEAQPMQQRGSL